MSSESGGLSLPPFFDHEPATLRWNSRSFVSCVMSGSKREAAEARRPPHE